MVSKNAICWLVVGGAYVALVLLGSSQPISMKQGQEGPLAGFWRSVRDAPIAMPGQTPQEKPPEKPQPPAPPQVLSRTEAETLIHVSGCRDATEDLKPYLRRSIRVSALPLAVYGVKEPGLGESRIAFDPDLPSNFDWPESHGQPLTFLAQINLEEVAPLDEEELLPATGWLYFFYGTLLDPPALGSDPNDADAWAVAYYDGNAGTLQQTEQPKSTAEQFAPSAVRFWHEWTLPALDEEPKLLRPNDRCNSFYYEVCAALSYCADVSDWHHLLGNAQNLGGPMRRICDSAANGRDPLEDSDPNDWRDEEPPASAKEWVLLFQVDLDALDRARIRPPNASGGDVRWGFSGSRSGRLYYWIREADLRDRDFSRVWVIRQGYYDGDEYEDGEYDDDEDWNESGD